MIRFALSYLGAALCIAFVIDRWLHRKQEPPAPVWDESEDGIQPPDPRPVFLVGVRADDPWVGTYSNN